MRRRVAYSRDTLQAHLLPTTEHMELNYRPALPPSAPFYRAALISGGLIVAAFAFFYGLLDYLAPALANVWGALLLALVFLGLLLRYIAEAGAVTWDAAVRFRRGMAFAVIATTAILGVMSSRWLPLAAALAPTILAVTSFSFLVAKNFAFWTTANSRVDWREMRLFQSLWPRLLSWETPRECPEMLTSRLAFAVLTLQTWLACEVVAQLKNAGDLPAGESLAGVLGWATLVLPLPLYWAIWHALGVVPRIPVGSTIKATLKSLEVWLGYRRTPAPRPGLFSLPDKWLRPAAVRETLTVVVLVALANCLVLLASESGRLAPFALLDQIERLLFGGWSDNSFAILQAMVAGSVAVVLPLVTLGVMYWFLAGTLVARYWLALEAPGAYAQSATKSPWAISVDRMLNSRDRKEREHVLLGRAIFGDYPVLLHKPLLYQHAHLVGDSGSRKTSLGIAPLMAQLLAAQDCSVIVLDLKGDRSLFETARLEADWAQADFRWFSLEAEQSSHVFNPIEQSHFQRLTPHQQTQIVLEGLSLNYGDAYGRGYYSAMNEVVLLNLARHYRTPSFRNLHGLLADKNAYATIGNIKDWDKAQHLSALVDRLASVYSLNVTAAELANRPAALAARIDMGELLSKPQVAYFSLRTPVEPLAAPAVAKLAMHSIFAASAHRLPNQKMRVYVIIDEFQQVISESIQNVLEMARGNSVHFIVAHQNIGQLNRKGVDVRATVSSCTAVKQFFRASDLVTIKQLEELSGEGMFETLSWEQALPRNLGPDHDDAFSPHRALLGAVEVSETIGNRLERNTVIDVSAAPNTSFVSFTEGSHFTQFSGYVTPVISDYHISLTEYDERNDAAWPVGNDDTVVNPPADAAQPQTRLRAPGAQPSPSTEADDDSVWDERVRESLRELANSALAESPAPTAT